MQAVHRDRWLEVAAHSIPDDSTLRRNPDEILKTDTSALLGLIWDQWQNVFKKTLGHSERSQGSELRTTRNAWAHQTSFSTDDAYRALDSVARLLSAISAPEAEEVEKQKQELLRSRFEEQAKRESGN